MHRETGFSLTSWPRCRRALGILLIGCAGISACVSSPETRQASTQYKVALNAYVQDLQAFEDAWVGEIDRLLLDLDTALVARAVTEKVKSLSSEHDGFASVGWQREAAAGGLITLSEAIDDERDRVHGFLDVLDGIELPEIDDPEAIVDSVLAEYKRLTIATIELRPDLSDEEKLRLRTEAELGPFGADAVANSIVRVIITWRAARAAIPADIENLEAVLKALKKAHASVDRWIQTDVTVPGEDLAALVNAWSAAVGDTP